jgi:hypothetical protein
VRRVREHVQLIGVVEVLRSFRRGSALRDDGGLPVGALRVPDIRS